jgi:transglutaminase-like putative cysteine protease
MRLQIDATLDYVIHAPSDVLLAIEAAPMLDQRLVEDRLTISGAGPLRAVPGDDGVGRRTWMLAEGNFFAHYTATIEVERAGAPLHDLPISSRRDLPAEVIPYIWPSRYCESDRFGQFVSQEFAGLEGGTLVEAMADWIHGHVSYIPGSSNETTTASDIFIGRAGVCRDYAHLMTAFARAAAIPARLVSAYAFDLNPPDFHAVTEVWLDGAWHLIDATRLAPPEGFARIAVGRDATDIAFMTIFGPQEMRNQWVQVIRVDE